MVIKNIDIFMSVHTHTKINWSSDLQQEEDFQEMEEAARKIESHNWQFFDHVIVNDELQDSCVQLLTVVMKAQDEPQWVPASWIRPTTES